MPSRPPSPSPELLLSLSPAVLRALVATFGPIAGLKAGAPHVAIVRAIFEGRAPAKLARVLASSVGRFGSDAGRRAIVEAARARRDARWARWLESPAADVCAELAIERENEKGRARRAVDRLFALAGMRLERELAERPTYELIATTTVAHDTVARAIEGALGARVHDLWTHLEEDGTFRVAVFLRLPTTTRLVAEGDQLVPRVDLPIAVDLLRVSANGSRARVALCLARPELLPEYASALGLSLRPSLTLRPLHDLTQEKLARVPLPRTVRSVTVVARRVRRPDGSRYETRAFDALDPAHEGGVERSGYVDRATLRAVIGERDVDAFLQLPHRVEISDAAPELETPMREVLGALGVFDPGVLPDDARSLAPYVHGDWRWRSVVGDEAFESLVARKRLAREIAAHVATEGHRMHGAGYVARDVRGEDGVQYALAEDRSLGARLVGKEDRLAWRLDRAALAAAMRADLGAAASGRPQAIDLDGVLDLGVVALASGKLRFVYAMGTPPKGWVGAAARACGIGTTLVVMVPRGHGGSGSGLEGVLVIELDVEEQLGVRRIGRALGKAAEALGVAGEVDAWRLCEEELVVCVKTQRVWIGGVLVALTEKPYRFVEFLARNAGRVATTKEIGSYVSSSGYPDDAARRIRADVERQARRSLAGAGADEEIARRLVVAEGKLGYRLGVSARVV